MNGFGTVVGSCHHTLDTFKQRVLNKQAEQRLALQTKTTGRIENSHNHLKHPISFTNTYIKGPSPLGIPRLRDMATSYLNSRAVSSTNCRSLWNFGQRSRGLNPPANFKPKSTELYPAWSALTGKRYNRNSIISNLDLSRIMFLFFSPIRESLCFLQCVAQYFVTLVLFKLRRKRSEAMHVLKQSGTELTVDGAASTAIWDSKEAVYYSDF